MMSDSRLLAFFSVGLILVLLLLVVFLVVVLVKVLRDLLTSQEVENQRLRNQVLTMGDLSALERLNRTTEVQRTTKNSPNSSNSDKPQFNPNDIVNTPTGPVIEVPQPDGTIKIMSVADLDPGLMGMGWTPDPDMDIDAIVTPDGDYHAGPYQG